MSIKIMIKRLAIKWKYDDGKYSSLMQNMRNFDTAM